MNEYTSSLAAALTACACGGTGEIQWTDEGRMGETVTFVSNGTSLCPCRRSLLPREGKAEWWTLESIYSAEISAPINPDAPSVTVSVKAELPVGEGNYLVVRRGNRYWPTLVDLSFGDGGMMLFPETAREIAKKLNEAADAADGVDKADTDPCGHWSPCSCQHTEAV